MKTARAVRLLNLVPALMARTQFGQILNRVQRNQERFVVGKRGAPLAVIMGVEDYLRNFARRPRALERIQRAARAKRLEVLPLRTINLEIRRYRKARRRND